MNKICQKKPHCYKTYYKTPVLTKLNEYKDYRNTTRMLFTLITACHMKAKPSYKVTVLITVSKRVGLLPTLVTTLIHLQRLVSISQRFNFANSFPSGFYSAFNQQMFCFRCKGFAVKSINVNIVYAIQYSDVK